MFPKWAASQIVASIRRATNMRNAGNRGLFRTAAEARDKTSSQRHPPSDYSASLDRGANTLRKRWEAAGFIRVSHRDVAPRHSISQPDRARQSAKATTTVAKTHPGFFQGRHIPRAWSDRPESRGCRKDDRRLPSEARNSCREHVGLYNDANGETLDSR